MLFGRRGVTQNDIRYIFEASYFIKNIYRTLGGSKCFIQKFFGRFRNFQKSSANCRTK